MNKKIIFSLIATVMITNFSFANLNVSEKTTTRFFLDNYYISYSLGKSIETKIDNQNVVISEVLNITNETINGYIVYNKDRDEVLYFVEYLRETQEIKAIDFKNNITDIVNLNKDNKFEQFIKINIIEEINKTNNNPASTLKFWGESCGGSWSTPNGQCYKTCCYYVLWMNTGCDVVGC